MFLFVIPRTPWSGDPEDKTTNEEKNQIRNQTLNVKEKNLTC